MELSKMPFVPEKFLMVESLDELKDHAALFSSQACETVAGSSIGLTDDGLISVGSDQFHITRTGFMGLCSTLRIPNPFARRIPFDLLQFNVQRLSRQQQELSIFRVTSNGHLSNICKPRIAEGALPVVQTIDMLVEKCQLRLSRAEISEVGAVLDFLHPDSPNIEHPKVGDITDFGWRILISECGAYRTVGKFMATVLRCTNGLVAPRYFGTIKARLRGKPESRINNLGVQLLEEQPKVDRFVHNYNYIADHPEMVPPNVETSRLWMGLRKILGDPDLADEVLGLSEDNRKELRQRAKAERLALSINLNTESADFAPVMSESWWSVLNRVTSTANKLSGIDRRKTQELAGKLLYQVTKSLEIVL
ncbi:MAG: hypothetical protein UY48_C0031G0008 [Candidatus Gottesmanbacteria bacterium GW2011_GWB1_49_7]|uniref:Uncharacterized protein n=1 Tax=Candidatus Gottesmanbacteria bacterium GW2011_GWB1_49_7 TaxID=1618448 RepID=A0A0G1YWM1_9BACT|nr:MAG: hypothetical protein UY48_C0031G0008 [Candidatus Gottesmanbacteria bacterium GW2011_GWB1_49_7]